MSYNDGRILVNFIMNIPKFDALHKIIWKKKALTSLMETRCWGPGRVWDKKITVFVQQVPGVETRENNQANKDQPPDKKVIRKASTSLF